MDTETQNPKRIGGNPTYSKIWKSREAFFDVALTFKAVDALCSMEPALHFKVWSAVDQKTGKLVHGVECCESIGGTRYMKFESFMKGFWTALN